MRREDLRLRALARQGDAAASLKLARLYLQGAPGQARNLPTGLALLRALPAADAAALAAGALSLPELVGHGLLDALRLAAEREPQARIKLAAWLLLTGEEPAALALLAATPLGAPALQALRAGPDADADAGAQPLERALRLLDRAVPLPLAESALAAAQRAFEARELERLARALALCAATVDPPSPPLLQLVAQAALLAFEGGHPLPALPPALLQAALEQAAAQGSAPACHLLGRALCGLPCAVPGWDRLAAATNLRKGSALLLRAADAGVTEAWLALYRVSADHRSSVANPQLALFCLEKAAQRGDTESMRRLGAIGLREAADLAATERALDLLFRAAAQGDAIAPQLMASLVLPLPGSDDEALAAAAEVHRHDPWLGHRLQLARLFGLTKLEALSVDPAAGARAWGLVVGPNPFVAQVRLAAPRAVPALSQRASGALRQAAAFFGAVLPDSSAVEGGLRKRSLQQRRLFDRLQLSEHLFFAQASSAQRDALRIGARWAHRARGALRQALAESAPPP
jgi:hypothetical protein